MSILEQHFRLYVMGKSGSRGMAYLMRCAQSVNGIARDTLEKCLPKFWRGDRDDLSLFSSQEWPSGWSKIAEALGLIIYWPHKFGLLPLTIKIL